MSAQRDIWAEKSQQTNTLPSMSDIYKKGRVVYDYHLGRHKGQLASKSDTLLPKRTALEEKLEKELYGNIEMDYDSIKEYLLSHPDTVNDINEAFSTNLSLQGKPQEEIDEALSDLKEPWRVNYVYSLLTTSTPDYTVDVNVEPQEVKHAIDTETQLKGGKRL